VMEKQQKGRIFYDSFTSTVMDETKAIQTNS
jgi:hypothetical protein